MDSVGPDAGAPRDPRSMADPELIRSVGQGPTAALAEIYQRYLPSVWRHVLAQVRWDPHAAEDVVSEVFVAAVRGLEELAPEGAHCTRG